MRPGAPAPDPTAVELAFWDSVKHSTQRADFEEYLRQYPTGHFVGLAKNRLAALGATGTQVAVGIIPSSPKRRRRRLWATTGPIWCWYRPGSSVWGVEQGDADEKPQHRVYLDAFYIDKHEVTNARFQQFVRATGHRTRAERDGSGYVYTGQTWEQVNGANWRAPRGPGSSIASLEQHPVVQVSQEDATAYCSWAGKRLPTEAEWEKAARGTDGQIYPWGNQFEGKRANFCDTNCEMSWKDSAANDGYRYTAPVGSYEGAEESLWRL